MSEMKVPFTRPTKFGNETDHILKVVNGGGQLAGGGFYNKACEKLISNFSNGSPALMVTSCTHALEMSALLIDLKPGDEVIIPSFTFVSSANAFLLRGAVIRFADNDEYGNIDVNDVERLISSKTKAVVAVHYAGNSCDMNRLSEICKSKKIHLIEDAAQSIGSKFKGRDLGSFGTFGCISFHDTKNLTSGEGGALVCNDRDFHSRAEILREKGTNRSQFLQGIVDKYTWVDIGSSYVLSELNAAYLFPQLENLAEITTRRTSLWNTYKEELGEEFLKMNVRMIDTPKDNSPNAHTFAILFNSKEARAKFIEFTRDKGVSTPFHYVALHTSPMGKQFLRGDEKLDSCMKFSDGLARLPLFYNMNEAEQTRVLEVVSDFARKFV